MIDYNKKPQELNPVFTDALLHELDLLMQETQIRCIEQRFDTKAGDSHYSFGHSARAWRIKAIERFIQSHPDYNLKVLLNKGNRFEFAICETPLKIYSGSLDNIPKNVFKKTLYETAPQLELDLGFNPQPFFWRLIVQTTPGTHSYVCTYLLAFNEQGDKIYTYNITVPVASTPYDPSSPEASPVVLPEPSFTKKQALRIAK